MAIYTRRQATLLMLFVAAAGVGLAIGQWRRANPELEARIERFDQPDPTTSETTAAPLVAPRDSRQPRMPRVAQVGRNPGPPTGEMRPRAPSKLREGDPGATPIDINQASAEELTRLPGIGPALAARIVAAREADGPFTAVDDLRRVSGVGASRVERLRSLVTTSP